MNDMKIILESFHRNVKLWETISDPRLKDTVQLIRLIKICDANLINYQIDLHKIKNGFKDIKQNPNSSEITINDLNRAKTLVNTLKQGLFNLIEDSQKIADNITQEQLAAQIEVDNVINFLVDICFFTKENIEEPIKQLIKEIVQTDESYKSKLDSSTQASYLIKLISIIDETNVTNARLKTFIKTIKILIDVINVKEKKENLNLQKIEKFDPYNAVLELQYLFIEPEDISHPLVGLGKLFQGHLVPAVVQNKQQTRNSDTTDTNINKPGSQPSETFPTRAPRKK